MEDVIRKRFQSSERRKFLSTPLTVSFNANILFSCAVAFIIQESEENGNLYVLLTKRTSSLSSFANDVCLPGGKYDDNLDNNVVNAAMREVREEVGVDPGDLNFVCTLPTFCIEPILGKPDLLAVNPVVFWRKKNKELQVNTSEVDTTFWIPLAFFLNSANHRAEKFTTGAGPVITFTVFTYFYAKSRENIVIYGCTGNICVTASSIALDASPEFPFTSLVFYRTPDNGLVFAEVSTTPLTSLPLNEDWKIVPYIISSKL